MSTTTHPATTPGDEGTPAIAAPNRSLLHDTGIVMSRELRPVRRDPFSVIFGMVQPLVFLGLFGPLLAGSLGGRSDALLGGDVWQWFVPSILVMTTLFGLSATGSGLQFEMQTGAHERMLVTPLSRPSLLIGRALKEIVPLALQAAVIILAVLPFGFRFNVPGAVIGLLLLAVFGIGVGSLSYALALAVREQDWMFWAVQQTVLFPLMLLSGMLLPLDAGPSWMRAAARINPMAHLLEAERALFAGDLTSSTVLWGVVAALTTAVVGLVVGVRGMARSTD